MRFHPPLLRGQLLRRYKRFLADVRLEDGQQVTAHCANPGSMLGLADPGRPVALSHDPSPTRKLDYTWELIRPGRSWVGVNTQRPNALVAEALEKGQVPELSGYEQRQREVRVGKSRLDFLLQSTKPTLADCYLEVKCVTLSAGKRALFPDAVTLRGQKHLHELMQIATEGQRAVMLFWINRGDCSEFAPANEIDPSYGQLLRQAKASGVEILAYRAKVSPKQVTLDQPIPILL